MTMAPAPAEQDFVGKRRPFSARAAAEKDHSVDKRRLFSARGRSPEAADPPAGKASLKEALIELGIRDKASSPSSPSRPPAIRGGSGLAQVECTGWKEKSLKPGAELCHNPILNQVDVFVRDAGGMVQRFQPSKGIEYHEAVRRAAATPVQTGRKKALAEFGELCSPSKPRRNPHFEACLAHNRRAFARHRGPCALWNEIAKGYPGSPRPFEPFVPGPATPAAAGQQAQPTLPRAARQSAPRPNSARVRRPPPARAEALNQGGHTPMLIAPPLRNGGAPSPMLKEAR